MTVKPGTVLKAGLVSMKAAMGTQRAISIESSLIPEQDSHNLIRTSSSNYNLKIPGDLATMICGESGSEEADLYREHMLRMCDAYNSFRGLRGIAWKINAFQSSLHKNYYRTRFEGGALSINEGIEWTDLERCRLVLFATSNAVYYLRTCKR